MLQTFRLGSSELWLLSAAVLSGLAINIERPFGAGDWISVSDQTVGQVMQINWRTTWLRTWSHDTIIIPNSVISKMIVTNHSRPKGPHRCIINLSIDGAVPPSRVIEALMAAASSCAAVAHGTAPQAYACAFLEALITYELAFAIESFALTPTVRSDMLSRINDAFREVGIGIGPQAMDVRIVSKTLDCECEQPGHPRPAHGSAHSLANRH